MACPFSHSENTKVAHDSQAEREKEIPIPQPPPSIFNKNFSQVDPNFPTRSFQQLAELYGEIFQLDLGTRAVFVSTQKLVNEVCDEDRFHKDIQNNLFQLRPLIGDGLFTAAHDDGALLKKEPNWWKAHRLLVPAFGPLGLRKMFDDMLDLSAQMVQRFDRMGENHIVNSSDDFTRLAFDTIGLCGFGYRFNEFYTDNTHPFAQQMANVLTLSARRANRSDLENKVHYWEEQSRQADVKAMHELANQIVDERKANPKPDAKDLLNTMIYGVDRETGETLGQENIVYNMVTFLAAGHETTSGTLSFLWYNLLKNPEKFHKAQQEIDNVVGDSVVTPDMLPKLTYIDACIKETLRLNGPISLFTVVPREDTWLANGKYAVKKDTAIFVNIKGLHHDPAIWGSTVNDFEPERFLGGGFESLPPHSWLPFGRGLRGCIGRFFAEQEMLINTAMILQRFTPELADPQYTLRIKSTLTVKPDGLTLKMRRRPGKTLYTGIPGSVISATTTDQETAQQHPAATQAKADPKSTTHARIFYGGNSGTCEGLSQMLQTNLGRHGVQSEVLALDAATEGLSTDIANIIIASSYEGKPADNAKKFVAWLEKLSDADTSELKDVRVSVFGVGDHNWPTTFHRIPKLINEKLQQLGAQQVAPTALADVQEDLLGPFDEWSESVVKVLSEEGAGDQANKESLRVSVEKGGYVKSLEAQKATASAVLKNVEIADTTVGAAKRHMEIRLPEDVTYVSGDYLAIQPRNPDEAVRRVLRYFKLEESSLIKISASNKKFLPTEPVQVGTFFYDYVELATPVTKRLVQTIVEFAETSDRKQELEALCRGKDGWSSIAQKRYNVLDIVEEYSINTLPLHVFIDMLLPLTPRQYSISSSPLADDAQVASVTYDVHAAPALSGHGVFEGVCSSYLASRRPGDQIYCSIRPSNVNFRLPASPDTPILLFAAGTGIAPMRAFLQERAAIATARSVKLGTALLFYGCRDPDHDFLYRDELLAWEKQGVVQVFAAHSAAPSSGRPKYVQDAIWEERELCAELFRRGGRIYVCGSAERLAKGVAGVCKKIYLQNHAEQSEKDAQAWLDSIKTDRYISDVY
ncbi:hypothetical protein QQS21_002060 [Conoideocrella luteorostrata]|uniref:Bifunctional cytochrome P450/NADPH--P450 reductase n=1 Tax=Conoideocrella luteorostrata TaxID=1105319 RepID=A0AAJ0G1M2_9HYPO|nr:hypothetical protein QQS21_002060 [Conoideocrella luteorostrata]